MGDIELYQAIGTLTAEVKGLRRDLEKNEQRSETASKLLMDRLDALTDVNNALSNKVEELEVTYQQEVEPVIRDVQNWKARGMGAIAMVGVSSGLATLGFGSVWAHVVGIFSGAAK